MGTFAVTAELGDMRGRSSERLELLVDTGSSYSFIPSRTLERLGIRVTGQRPLRLSNEERVFSTTVGRAIARVDGIEEVTLIMVGEPDIMPSEAHAVEGLGLGMALVVNP